MRIELDRPTAVQRTDKKGRFYNIGSLYFKVISRELKLIEYAK